MNPTPVVASVLAQKEDKNYNNYNSQKVTQSSANAPITKE